MAKHETYPEVAGNLPSVDTTILSKKVAVCPLCDLPDVVAGDVHILFKARQPIEKIIKLLKDNGVKNVTDRDIYDHFYMHDGLLIAELQESLTWIKATYGEYIGTLSFEMASLMTIVKRGMSDLDNKRLSMKDILYANRTLLELKTKMLPHDTLYTIHEIVSIFDDIGNENPEFKELLLNKLNILMAKKNMKRIAEMT